MGRAQCGEPYIDGSGEIRYCRRPPEHVGSPDRGHSDYTAFAPRERRSHGCLIASCILGAGMWLGATWALWRVLT